MHASPRSWQRFTKVTDAPARLSAQAIARPDPPQPTTAARRPAIDRRWTLASTPVGSVVAATQAGPRRNMRFADAARRAARLRMVANARALSLFGEATVSPWIDIPICSSARLSTISCQNSAKESTLNGRNNPGYPRARYAALCNLGERDFEAEVPTIPQMRSTDVSAGRPKSAIICAGFGASVSHYLRRTLPTNASGAPKRAASTRLQRPISPSAKAVTSLRPVDRRNDKGASPSAARRQSMIRR